jgi:cytochrome c-type biogenesis protein CcsB
MTYWETIFFWTTMVIFALTSVGFIYAFVFKNPRVIPKLTWLVAASFLSLSVAIGFRFAATGHLPWSGDYECALMGGWIVLAGTLYLGWRNEGLQGLAVATVPLVMLMMGFGYMRNPVLTPMAASLKTVWLYIHVYFAQLAFGSYSLAMAAAVLFLLKQRDSLRPVPNPSYERFPAGKRLEELIFRYVLFGFITDTIMIGAGAIWAKDLWGSYWSWDPVETWSLISWLTYGICIHLRVTMGWRGTRLAWLAILALSSVIITFFGVTFVVNTSMHMFNVR